ncbi:MAG: hypothetical protein V2A58_13350, partial [Planctomycetota bacterium]
YAAKALSRRTAVTYSESEARIATTETRRVRVEIPPGAKVLAVEMVPHEGKVRRWPAKIASADGETRVEMKVEDCALQALYYRIRYRLA